MTNFKKIFWPIKDDCEAKTDKIITRITMKQFLKPTKFKILSSIVLFFVITPVPLFFIAYGVGMTSYYGSVNLNDMLTIALILFLLVVVPYVISCTLYPLWEKVTSVQNKKKKMLLKTIIIAPTVIFMLILLSVLYSNIFLN